MIREFKRCPNCGKKGLYITKNVVLADKKARCKYCEMEFEPALENGILVMKGDLPVFSVSKEDKR